MLRRLVCIFSLLAAGLLHAGESTSLRYVEFRDGSILRLPLLDEEWKITVVRPNGVVDETLVRSTSLQSLTLTTEPGLEKKRVLLTAVRQLSSEDFVERERAYDELLKHGPAIRADLETCLQFTTDMEARGRLTRILERFTASSAPPVRAPRLFDVFTIKEPSWGYVGDDRIAVLLDGKSHRLLRKDIQGMSVAAPPGFIIPGATSPASDLRRIGPNDFPPDSKEEGFESTPEGKALSVGENIEKVFIKKGFTLSTSIAGSHVSVNNFQVNGKSRGMSVATHLPLWEGEITIRFCQPGRENVPAGVTHFGCHIAAVMPKGTAMVAYDVMGRQLGAVHTQTNGHDFIAFTSTVPIHRIRFVPDMQLDRDYTLDDFIFSPPITHEAVHPEKFFVQLVTGERVLCHDVILEKGRARLEGMPANLPDRVMSVDDLVRVSLPEKIGKAKDDASSTSTAMVFAELRDGSILLAKEQKDDKARPVFARKPNLFQETNHLVGLWSSHFPRVVPPLKEELAIMWDQEQRRWNQVTNVRFLDDMVTWKHDGQDHSLAYGKLPPFWLATPAEQAAAASWRVRTRHQEELVLTNPQNFAGRLSQELSATWQGQPIRLSASELSALVHVVKD